jgi:hypothetical protein
MLQEPTGLTISCGDVALRALGNILLFPSGLSPHPTNAPLSRFPASEGGMKTGKKGSSRMLSCISELSYYSQNRHSYLWLCQVTTEALSTVPQQLQVPASNTSTWHPMEDFTKSRQAQAAWPARSLS